MKLFTVNKNITVNKTTVNNNYLPLIKIFNVNYCYLT